MRLVSVYKEPRAVALLYDLLKEREDHVNISHRAMPTMSQHRKFVAKRPYSCWYLIDNEAGAYVGSIYLSRQDEIGVFIFRAFQRRSFAADAIRLLMEKHQRLHYLANINPANAASIRLFAKFGFVHIQNTYELRP